MRKIAGVLGIALFASATILAVMSSWNGAEAPVVGGQVAREGRETPIALASAGVRYETTQTDSPARASEATTVSRLEQDLRAYAVTVADLEKPDADRVRRVCAVLAEASLGLIDARARISPDDLTVLREIVDEAEKSVSSTGVAFTSAASQATRPRREELMDRIRRQETEGLPLLSKSNPFRRLSPHEAIAQVNYEGKAYVVRVTAAEDPRLALAGSAYDTAVAQRLHDYTSLVVPLFH